MFDLTVIKRKKVTGLITLLLSATGGVFANSANGAVAGFTSVNLSPQPVSDLVISGALNTNDDLDFDITNTTILNSFTTEFGTVDTLAGVTSVLNLVTENSIFAPGPGTNDPPEIDSIRNFWGFQGSEIDGANSLLGLDVAHGTDNALFLDAFFGTILNDTGASGLANDIFLTEFFGDDSIRIFPLNQKGSPISDFVLEINTGIPGPIFNPVDIGQWGDTGFDIAALIDFTSGNLFDDQNLVGVAFDLSDFQGTGLLTGVAGIRIEGTTVNGAGGSVDLGVIGYNTLAVPVPESISPYSFGLIFLLFCFHQIRSLRS